MTFILAQILNILILLIVELAVFFGLAKLFNKKTKWLTILAAFSIYELVFFVLQYIYYPNILYNAGGIVMHFVRPLSLIIVSGSIFLIATKKLNLFSFRKGLIFFLLMVIIVTPIISWAVGNFIVEPMYVRFVEESNYLNTINFLADMVSREKIPFYEIFLNNLVFSIGEWSVIQDLSLGVMSVLR